MVSGQLSHLAGKMHAAVGQQNFGLADATRIKDDLARCGIAGVVFIADAKVEIAERKPNPLAAPSNMDHLAFKRHRAAKRRTGLGRQLLLETGVEGEIAGPDNKLAHPMGPWLLKPKEIAATGRRSKNILSLQVFLQVCLCRPACGCGRT